VKGVEMIREGFGRPYGPEALEERELLRWRWAREG
jgi:hypothetical protein